MAKLCGASLLLVLLAALHLGSALHCYESMCLNDLSINSCIHNNRTILKECNVAILRQNLNKLSGAGGSAPPIPAGNFPWACIKHEADGVLNGQPTEVDLKMCFPDSPSACDLVKAAAKGLEYQVGQQVVTRCSACTGDSCNPAHRPAASYLGAFVSVFALLLLRC